MHIIQRMLIKARGEFSEVNILPYAGRNGHSCLAICGNYRDVMTVIAETVNVAINEVNHDELRLFIRTLLANHNPERAGNPPMTVIYWPSIPYTNLYGC